MEFIHYKQTADIDASTTSEWDGGGWTPIGESYFSFFSGTYDGDGHVISGLTINRPDGNYQGLFASLSNAEIKNLGVTVVDISAKFYVGGLVGYSGALAVDSTVSNCYATGTVSGSNYVGGLVGFNDNGSTVENSFWDTETSGQVSSAGGTGKTTAEMKTESTFGIRIKIFKF